MQAVKFIAALMAVVCGAITALGLVCAIYTGDPLWQPVVSGAVAWAILTPAAIGLNAVVEWLGDWSGK